MNNNKNELVSVILGTKNRFDLFPRALKSLINQTYRNIEIIILDASTDDKTKNYCQTIDDERIKYYYFEHDPGRMETLDLGIKYAKGQYVTFLDDDDEYLPTKIEKQINRFLNCSEDIGLIYTWSDYIDTKTNKIKFRWYPTNKGNVIDKQIEKQSIGSFISWMVRKDIFERIGGIKQETKFPSDWEVGCQIALICKIDFIEESLVKVYIKHTHLRMQEQIISSNESTNNLLDFYLYFLKKYENQFNIFPRSRFSHYLAISRIYARFGKYSEFVKYYKLAFFLKPMNFKLYKSFIKSNLLFLKVKFK
jgi:glycosyltransferase involved in cell wall biosynthesis